MIDGQPQNEDWSSSLFACCDSCTCCCACILPCIVLGQNVHQMQQLGITPIPIVDDCECQYGNKACVAGLLYGAGTALSFLGSVLSMYNPYWGNLAWLECRSTCLHASRPHSRDLVRVLNPRGSVFKTRFQNLKRDEDEG